MSWQLKRFVKNPFPVAPVVEDSNVQYHSGTRRRMRSGMQMQPSPVYCTDGL